jgi:hypothetical protein
LGLCVLDQKRIDELRKFAAQKQNAKILARSQVKSLAPGMLVFPPMLPDTAPFENGKYPVIPALDPENLHPHMMGILGIPIDEQILGIMKEMTARQKQATFVEMEAQVSNPQEQATQCPRCLGAGFRHDSSSKHDKKPNERCKGCVKCRGNQKLIRLQRCGNRGRKDCLLKLQDSRIRASINREKS